MEVWTPSEVHCTGKKRKAKLLTNPAENEELHMNKKYLSEKIAEELNVLRISQPSWVLPQGNKSNGEKNNRFSRDNRASRSTESVMNCENNSYDGKMSIENDNSDSGCVSSEDVDDIEDLHKLLMREQIKKLFDKPSADPLLKKLLAQTPVEDNDPSKAIILYKSPKLIIEEGIGLRNRDKLNIDEEDLEMMTEDAPVQTFYEDDGGSDTVTDVSAAPVVANGYGYYNNNNSNFNAYPYPPQQYYQMNNNNMFYNNVNNFNNNFVNNTNNSDNDNAMDEDISVL